MVVGWKPQQLNEREYASAALHCWRRTIALGLPRGTQESLRRDASRLQLSRAQEMRLESEATIALTTVIDQLILDISSPHTRRTPSRDTPPDEPLPQLDPL